jgi:hypothetical protein
MKKQHEFATRAIHAGQEPDPSTGAVMTPIYATSTYVQESPGKHKGYDYARSINPTRLAYEKCIADLESGTRGFAFASGLAAMATVLELLESGSHIVVSDDLYGGTFRLFDRVRRRSANLDFTYVDLTDADDLERAIKPNTRMVWIETPSNPLLKLIDLEAIAKIAREHKIISVCDNTFATPWIQRPIENGFDVVVHSATKYLNGHSDLVSGVVVVGDNKELADQIAMARRTARGEIRPLSRVKIPSAPRSGTATNARLRRNRNDRFEKRSRGHQAFSGEHTPVCAGGKFGWCRKPYQSPGAYDACFGTEGAARKTRRYRFARQAFGGRGRCPRFNRRFEERARSDLTAQPRTCGANDVIIPR